MRDNVFHITPSMDVAATLRRIADDIDPESEDTCTLVIGADIYHLGAVNDERAVEQAIWNLNYGIQLIMKAALSFLDE